MAKAKPKKIATQKGQAKHPMQPLVLDDKGVIRFKQNEIVQLLLDTGTLDLNKLAVMNFTREDREQLAQLIGYSLSGFGELSYVSDATYNAAHEQTPYGRQKELPKCQATWKIDKDSMTSMYDEE